MAKYDPQKYDTWPQEQQDFAGEVMASISDGDLLPLARYLRAGHQLEPAMANQIADMMERVGWGRYHIITKGRHRGEAGRSASMEWHDRKMQIGVYMEDRIRQYGQGGYDSALSETLKKFEIKSGTTVAKALKYVRDYMSGSKCAPGWDQWAHLKAFYYTP